MFRLCIQYRDSSIKISTALKITEQTDVVRFKSELWFGAKGHNLGLKSQSDTNSLPIDLNLMLAYEFRYQNMDLMY